MAAAAVAAAVMSDEGAIGGTEGNGAH